MGFQPNHPSTGSLRLLKFDRSMVTVWPLGDTVTGLVKYRQDLNNRQVRFTGHGCVHSINIALYRPIEYYLTRIVV